MPKTTNVSIYDLHTRIRSPIILSMLQIKSGDTFLDLGSGTGYFSETIAQQKTTTCCLDISLENLRSIKAREVRDVCLINSEAETLPFIEESFDKVLCSEVLEHIKGDKEALREIARILKPGGGIVITVPCTELRLPSLIEMLAIKTVNDYEGPEKHYKKGYTFNDISDLLKAYDMVVAEHVYFSHFFSKLLLDIISIVHLAIRRIGMGQKSWQWGDIQDLNTSTVFKIYKCLFPLFLLISKCDKLFFLSSKAKGYGIAIKAKKLF